MAMIDYGAIAWKNGKLISTDMFTPMKDMVGWDDSDLDIEPPLEGNYFAYIGDKDLTWHFIKTLCEYTIQLTYTTTTPSILGANHLKVGRGGDIGQYLMANMLR